MNNKIIFLGLFGSELNHPVISLLFSALFCSSGYFEPLTTKGTTFCIWTKLAILLHKHYMLINIQFHLKLSCDQQLTICYNVVMEYYLLLGEI